MTNRDFSRIWQAQKKLKRACPKCHHLVFTEPRGYGICDYCGTKVLSKKSEFQEKIKNMLGGKKQ